MSARPNRRQIVGGIALMLGTAGAASASPAGHPDAELLALCARFETVQRRFNGIWLQGTRPRYYALSSYIEDDDAREIVAVTLELEADSLFGQIIERLPTTMEGMRALARCILLSEADLRHDPELEGEHFSLSDRGEFVVHRLFHSLAGGAITAQNCMAEPGVLRPEEEEPEFVVTGDYGNPNAIPAPASLEAAIQSAESAEQVAAFAAKIAAEARRRVDALAAATGIKV